jgi:hypothetical protein
LQNFTPSLIVGETPFFDLIQASEAAKAGKVIAQAAISDAR